GRQWREALARTRTTPKRNASLARLPAGGCFIVILAFVLRFCAGGARLNRGPFSVEVCRPGRACGPTAAGTDQDVSLAFFLRLREKRESRMCAPTSKLQAVPSTWGVERD